MSYPYTTISVGDQSNITVFVDGEFHVAPGDHPNYAAIEQAAKDGDSNIVDLFDVAQAAGKRFESLSERVSVAHGRIYLDGDEVNTSLTKQILRFLDEDVQEWKGLVAFFEKVQANPQEHSREQLYTWLDQHEFTITSNGDIVGYKGVQTNEKGDYESISRGPAIVDGESVNGNVPNYPGAVVEMGRGSVTHDPHRGCSSGLHVGTYSYARGFSRGAVLEVHVNPRDVVSVPTDCNWQKVRTCRYTVVDVIDTPYASGLIEVDYADEDEAQDAGVSENASRVKSYRVVSDRNGIERLLEDAQAADESVEIEYEKSGPYPWSSKERTTRTIKVSDIYNDYVSAYDVDKDEPRSFRFDRIKSANGSV